MTTQELADAWRDEELDFDDALLQHLEENFPDDYDLTVFFVLTLAISYSNMDLGETILEIDGQQVTAAQLIDRFHLHPFVNP